MDVKYLAHQKHSTYIIIDHFCFFQKDTTFNFHGHILSCLFAPLTHLVRYLCLYLSFKCWYFQGSFQAIYFLQSFRLISVCLLDHSWMFHRCYFKVNILVSSHLNLAPHCCHQGMITPFLFLPVRTWVLSLTLISSSLCPLLFP